MACWLNLGQILKVNAKKFPHTVALKDRVLTFQGGTAQIVLSSYAEEQYRIAVEAFQGGNYLQALATIERLLQDPKNKRSQKLLDLYKKIQARL